VPLKRSSAYGLIRPRVAALKPLDAWQADELHFFLFQLKAADGVSSDSAPQALFAMRADETRPVSALVITPDLEVGIATAEDLLRPGTTYTVPLG
jgi:hypothetical protein